MLLHGPSGAGKTTLVQLVAQHFRANLLTVDCSLLLATHHSVQLQELFTAAMRIQPTILLIEDLELLFPTVLDETKYKLMGKLVGCIDAISYDECLSKLELRGCIVPTDSNKLGVLLSYDLIGNLEFASVAVVGTTTSLGALHGKVRQLFAEEVPLEVHVHHFSCVYISTALLEPFCANVTSRSSSRCLRSSGQQTSCVRSCPQTSLTTSRLPAASCSCPSLCATASDRATSRL